jgi:hypothetical protein
LRPMGTLLAVAAGLLGIAGMVWAGPKAVVKESHWDFGKVPNFGHVAHNFRIQNAGDVLLRIDSVKTDCGCTTTNLRGATIPAGSQRSFQLAFNAGVLPRGGLKTEGAKIYTNDPQAGMLRFSLTTEVVTNGWEMVDVSPTVIAIDGGEQGMPSIQVRNKTTETVKISVLETSGFLAPAGARTSTAGPQASVEVKLKAHLPEGVNTRGPVPTVEGRPTHSSVTLVASGPKGRERFTIPSELSETVRTRRVNVEPY